MTFFNLYQEVFASIDTLAELIRTLDSYAPGTLTRLKELTSIEETDDVPDGKTMMTRLLQENNILRASLLTAYTTADTTGEVGIANFLQDRIQAHEKHSWMLRSILK
jgi:starvation-inducible DNA-binding protein